MSKPSHIAYIVNEATKNGEKQSYWRAVGAVWPHKNGEGFDVVIHDRITEAGFRPIGHLIFPKPYTSGARFLRYQHECAYLLAKGEPQEPEHPIADVIQWTHHTGNKLHPSQKPLNVLLPLIKAFCPAGGIVLDPFAGSGSSLVAARQLGRQFVGIEIDELYHRTATARLQEAQTLAA